MVKILYFLLAIVASAAATAASSNDQTVVLISLDGFRWAYLWKVPIPNIDRLRAQGTEAREGLIPVYPTLTFPNHYSMVTGLYPAWHGIIGNSFSDGKDYFNRSSRDPKWWLGEPIWTTVSKAGLQAVAYFWPGAEVIQGAWNCPKVFCPAYNQSVSFDVRVDSVLSDLRLPSSQRPKFVALYFDEPDTQGHQYGPDSPQVDEAIAKVDKAIGKLLDGIERLEYKSKVSIILVGDHGMVSNCEDKYIFLEDLSRWVKIEDSWVESTGALVAVRPPKSVNASLVLAKMQEGLDSGKVNNGRHLRLQLKQNLPYRLHYSASDRIQPIIGIADEGYSVAIKKPAESPCGGGHGYDNELRSMRSIFIAKGPRFCKGKLVDSFLNVNIYNIVTHILQIQGAPNNGTSDVLDKLLVPLHQAS